MTVNIKTARNSSPVRFCAKISSKLKSKRGASVILALIFFVVCLTLAAVILNAADISVRLLPQTADDRQEYLTLSSAAQLIRSELLDFGCDITEVTGISHGSADCPVNSSGEDSDNYIDVGDKYSLTAKSDGSELDIDDLPYFRDIIINFCEQVYDNGYSVDKTVELSASEYFDTMEAKISMNSNYTLTITLGLENSETAPILMTFVPTSISDEVSDSRESHDFDYGDGTQSCEVTVTRRNFSVTWGSCVVTKD